MIRLFNRPRPLAALLVATITMCGCGGGPPQPVAPVTGKVTFNGEPIPVGSVIFMPQGGGPPATGQIDENGVYTMTTFTEGDGAIPGVHTVMISALKDNGDFAAQTELLPQKFATEKSGLTADVKADQENTIDFTLEGVAPKPKREAPAMP